VRVQEQNVDATVASFANISLQAMDLAIPRNNVNKPKFPHWFSPLSGHYIRKEEKET
jgi:hypothetical protein